MVDPRPKRRLDRGMKATLFALFVALLMVGCAESTSEVEDKPSSLDSEVEGRGAFG